MGCDTSKDVSMTINYKQQQKQIDNLIKINEQLQAKLSELHYQTPPTSGLKSNFDTAGDFQHLKSAFDIRLSKLEKAVEKLSQDVKKKFAPVKLNNNQNTNNDIGHSISLDFEKDIKNQICKVEGTPWEDLLQDSNHTITKGMPSLVQQQQQQQPPYNTEGNKKEYNNNGQEKKPEDDNKEKGQSNKEKECHTKEKVLKKEQGEPALTLRQEEEAPVIIPSGGVTGSGGGADFKLEINAFDINNNGINPENINIDLLTNTTKNEIPQLQGSPTNTNINTNNALVKDIKGMKTTSINFDNLLEDRTIKKTYNHVKNMMFKNSNTNANTPILFQEKINS